MRSKYAVSVGAAIVVLPLIFSVSGRGAEEKVAFNVETKKYHCLSCRWAIACTKNCIEITISEARRRGGVPCKVCGGSCAKRRVLRAVDLNGTPLESSAKGPILPSAVAVPASAARALATVCLPSTEWLEGSIDVDGGELRLGRRVVVGLTTESDGGALRPPS